MHIPANVQQNIPLAPYTTLGVGGQAEYFVEVETLEALHTVLKWIEREGLRSVVLGGGSNMLIDDGLIEGVFIRPLFRGTTFEDTENHRKKMTVSAGELLDDTVSRCVEMGLWGIENLSGIPGTVGAMPIQNVGAYGTEAKDVVYSVTVYNKRTYAEEELLNDDCRFGYRDSIFKQKEGTDYIITAVTFLLSTEPKQNVSYKDLAQYFSQNMKPNLHEIREAVLAIRNDKFPDWQTVGTAGSFFKNPVVSTLIYDALHTQYPELPAHAMTQDTVKIPLGYVLDKICNVKGYRDGAVGLYEKQALVLTCEKGSSAQSIKTFSEKIITRVKEMTGLDVEREVTFIENKK